MRLSGYCGVFTFRIAVCVWLYVCVCVCWWSLERSRHMQSIHGTLDFFIFAQTATSKEPGFWSIKCKKNSIKCAEVSNENLLKICVCTGRWIWCSRWELVFLHTNWCARQWEKQNHGTTSIAAVWIDTPKSHMRIHYTHIGSGWMLLPSLLSIHQ